MENKTYNVFISYSHRDKALVEPIARSLSNSGIDVWLDTWSLVPGQAWQDAISKAIDNSSAVAVFIGPSGFGTQQNREVLSYITSSKPIIPILLPGADTTSIPRHLQKLQWIDFRDDANQRNAIRRLVVTLQQTNEKVVDFERERKIGDDLLATGDLTGASERYENALEIAQEQDNQEEVAELSIRLGDVKRILGDLDVAHQLYQQSYSYWDQKQNQQGKAISLSSMAYIHVIKGELDEAMRLYRESLEIQEEISDLKGKSSTLPNMAQIFVTRGELDEAMRLYQEALQIKESLGDIKGKSATLHQMANIFVTRGDLNEAMRLYRQSLEIKDALGDLQGKSATLHEIAYIYRMRGELDEAMRLYNEALKIDEGLGDLLGKSATLFNMGNVYLKRGNSTEALKVLLDSLQLLERVGARPDAQKVAETIIEFRQNIGTEKFEKIWRDVLNDTPMPEWLTESSGLTLEQLVQMCVTVAREKRPEASQLYDAVSKMATDTNASKELQALGKALRQILIGVKNPDLTELPEEIRNLIQETLASSHKNA
jgi:tetratricopeptide (TPR) repeat protein